MGEEMREILFKAKCAEEPYDWVEGYINKCEREFIISNDDGLGVFIKPDTICQYTGLTDNNGNKIWENDVVKKHFYTDYDACANSDEYVGFVKYEDFAWVIKSPKGKMIRTFPIIEAIAYSQDVKFFEVIGNIFDNPELLKEE